MPDPLDVHLYGVKIAELEFIGPLRYRLTYDDEWTQRPDAVPLSYSLPLTNRVHDGDPLLNFLDNLLPDGERVRERWAIGAGLDRTEPFGLLEAYGRDVAGAATFTPRGERARERGNRTLVDETQIAERIRRLRADDSDWVESTTVGGKFSLGGAQGKFALSLEEDAWWEPTGEHPTTHIFKPRATGLIDGEVVEYAIMAAATALGLATAPVGLARFGDEQSLVVQRFDRARVGDELIRIHQEDLCQAMGYSRLRKYEQYGGPGYRRILEFLATHAGPGSTRRFAESVFFSWLVLNSDAHAKNYSIQILPEQTTLSPLYDLSSLLPYLRPDDPAARERDIAETRLALRLVDDYRVSALTRFEWEGAARDAAISPSEFLDWGIELNRALPSAIDAAVDSIPSGIDTTIATRLADTIRSRSREVGRILARRRA